MLSVAHRPEHHAFFFFKSETIGNITYLIRVNGEKIEVPHTEGGGGIYVTGDDIG